mgnify:CR=1
MANHLEGNDRFFTNQFNMEDSTKRTCTALLLPLPTDEGNDSDEIKRIKQGPCKEEEE